MFPVTHSMNNVGEMSCKLIPHKPEIRSQKERISYGINLHCRVWFSFCIHSQVYIVLLSFSVKVQSANHSILSTNVTCI